MNALREERPWLINLRRFYRRKGINIGLEIFFFFGYVWHQAKDERKI